MQIKGEMLGSGVHCRWSGFPWASWAVTAVACFSVNAEDALVCRPLLFNHGPLHWFSEVLFCFLQMASATTVAGDLRLHFRMTLFF